MNVPESYPFLAKKRASRNQRIARKKGAKKMTDKHLRRPAVEDLTGLSRSCLYAMMAKGQFPRPVKLTGKAVAWPESKITEWLASREAA